MEQSSSEMLSTVRTSRGVRLTGTGGYVVQESFKEECVGRECLGRCWWGAAQAAPVENL